MTRNTCFVLCVVVLVLFGVTATAQEVPSSPAKVVVEGEVRDSVSGEPIASAQVTVRGMSVLTDDTGVFRASVVDFPVSFIVEARGHDRRVERVAVAPSTRLVVLLDPKLKRSESVDVSENRSEDPAAPTIPLRAQQVMQVAGAADNVFRTIQTLPGVATPEEFSSRLSVRGGGPDQNLTVMDGVEIHNPYRLFGLTSAFNPETVERFDLSTGAFSARYGDRLSSILVIDNREGLANRKTQGSATLSVTDGNALFEGPWRESNPDKGSWVVTARRTYYDLIVDRLIKQNLPGFQDVQFRGTWKKSESTRATLFGVRSRESGNARFDGDNQDFGAFVTDSSNDLFGLSTSHTFSDRVKTKSVLAFYDYAETVSVDALFEDGTRRSNIRGNDVSPQISVNFEQEVQTRDLSFRNELFAALSPNHLVETGAEWHALRTNVSWRIRGERNPVEANGSSVRGGASLPASYDGPLRTSRAGFYVQDRMTMGSRISTVAGLRFDRSSLTRNVEVQPRLSMLVKGPWETRVRGAFGRHTQSPGFEKLVQADYFFDLANFSLKNEVATHAVFGIERDFRGIEFKIEAYRKSFDQLIVGALETDAAFAARVARYDFPSNFADSLPKDKLITSNPENSAQGLARGIEVVMTKPRRSKDDRFSGWASYTYSKATRDQYGKTYAFEYDRRHAISVAGYVAGGPKFDLAFTIKVASGFPRTAPTGVVVAAVADSTDVDRDGNRTELIPQRDSRGLPFYSVSYGGVSNLLGARFPDFRRLDLRFNWRPRGDAGRWTLYLDIINATNRTNVGRVEPDLRFNPTGDRPLLVEDPQRSIPFLPSFGVRFKF